MPPSVSSSPLVPRPRQRVAKSYSAGAPSGPDVQNCTHGPGYRATRLCVAARGARQHRHRFRLTETDGSATRFDRRMSSSTPPGGHGRVVTDDVRRSRACALPGAASHSCDIASSAPFLPRLAARDIHTQLATSAVRPVPPGWRHLRRLHRRPGRWLAPGHDRCCAPAASERILTRAPWSGFGSQLPTVGGCSQPIDPRPLRPRISPWDAPRSRSDYDHRSRDHSAC